MRLNRFTQVAGFLALLVAPMGLEGQGNGHAFSYGTVSQSQLVNATRNCNRSVLRVSCDEQLAEANRVIGAKIPGLSFANRAALADYFATLDRRPCPAEEMASLSRVLGTRVRADDNWQRPFRVGEECLYDNNAGVYILSLSCANFIKSNHSVARAMPEPEQRLGVPPPQIVRVIPDYRCTDPRASNFTGPLPCRYEREYRPSWWVRNRGWAAPVLVTATAIGGYCAISRDCIRVSARANAGSNSQ